MPRFVVLRHDSPRGLHWDFMIEEGSVLKTWALPKPPDAAEAMTAEALPDHRLAFLDYEGPISGGRGSVTRWDGGTYRAEPGTDEQLAVSLQGERLAGRATLTRTSGDPPRWQFRFVPD